MMHKSFRSSFLVTILLVASLLVERSEQQDTCNYGVSNILDQKLSFLSTTVDVINITVNLPANLTNQNPMLSWWQYSSRYLMLQIELRNLKYLWFATMPPRVEEIEITLPPCAQNQSAYEIQEGLAQTLVMALAVDISSYSTAGERLCVGEPLDRYCCSSSVEQEIIFEPMTRGLKIATGLTCFIVSIIITSALCSVLWHNMTDSDWWSLDETGILHRDSSLPILLSLKPRRWSAKRMTTCVTSIFGFIFGCVSLVSLGWFILFILTMDILWAGLLIFAPAALMLGLLLLMIAGMLQRCIFKRSTFLLRIKSILWIPVAWLSFYLLFSVSVFMVMELLWFIVGVVIHANFAFPIFTGICVILFCTYHSLSLATERVKMAKKMTFDIYDQNEGNVRTKVHLSRGLFLQALLSAHVVNGQLALKRVFWRVATTMILVGFSCISLVTLLRFITNNSYVDSFVDSVLIALVAFMPTFILRHDSSDFSNAKLRSGLATYFLSLASVHHLGIEDKAVADMIRGVSADSLDSERPANTTPVLLHREDSSLLQSPTSPKRSYDGV